MFKYFTRKLPMVEIISDAADPRCLEIFRLRHKVVIDQCKMTINASNIVDSAKGKMIMDDHDMSPATVHYAVRSPKTGEFISSLRTVDANKATLDMEKHNWFQIDNSIKANGVAEWSRLVSDVSVRKTNAAFLLYLQSKYHQQDLGVNNMIFMVDSRATNLMKYYKRHSIAIKEISNGAVECNEYEQGRKSHVMLMPMGKPGTFERHLFTTTVSLPVTLVATFIK
jgi:hypothetical protein